MDVIYIHKAFFFFLPFIIFFYSFPVMELFWTKQLWSKCPENSLQWGSFPEHVQTKEIISLLKEITSKYPDQTPLQLRFPFCVTAWARALTESHAPCAWFEFKQHWAQGNGTSQTSPATSFLLSSTFPHNMSFLLHGVCCFSNVSKILCDVRLTFSALGSSVYQPFQHSYVNPMRLLS